jgi:hypothetical protein
VNQDFIDLLHELSAAEARFMVVGAYALAFHSRPRATGDMDLWVEPTAENAKRVIGALTAFGAPIETLSAADLATAGVVYQIGVAPRRIDILTSLTGLDFTTAWADHVTGTLGGVECPIIGREALIQNKRALGRPRDRADLELLGET